MVGVGNGVRFGASPDIILYGWRREWCAIVETVGFRGSVREIACVSGWIFED